MMSSKNDNIEEKATTSNLQQESTDEAEIDEGSDYGSTFETFRSEDEEVELDDFDLETWENIWPPCLEIEEFNDGLMVFSRMSSLSSVSSFLPINQPQAYPQSSKPKWMKGLLRPSTRPKLSTKRISSQPARAFKVFSRKELVIATKNFSRHCVIGIGICSTVYKCMLDDQAVVAVKKCWFTDKSPSKMFAIAKEILILSQINHVNVVKLLGYCLHVKRPMLVLEYIPNGTLFELIHQERDDLVTFPLDTRMRIASEIAKALVYLHSEISPPILHGHLKSSNILLDVLYTTKLSCFGTTFLEFNDKDLLRTYVRGTPGYVDPEYLETGELTDKSDVYSFGVVLLELLTRKKAVYSCGKEGADRNLSDNFFDCMIEDRVLDILDTDITSEGLTEQLQKVTKLAARCLREKGAERPTMKEVHMELEASKRSTTLPWVTDNTDDGQDMTILQTDRSKFQSEPIRSLGVDKGSNINMNVRREVDNTNGTISVGFWRYQTEYCFDEKQFDHCGYDGIKKIIIHSSCLEGKVNSIRIQYTKHGQLEWTKEVGEDEGDRFEIVLDDPDEYIMNVTGYISSFVGLCSLTFFTSYRKKYGPFGIQGTLEETHVQNLIPFEYSGGKLVGFRGATGRYAISSIGFHLQSLPQSCEKCRSKFIMSTASATEQVQQINVEVFGHFSSGTFFDHTEYEGIKRIFIGHERRINYFKVEYIQNGQPKLTDGIGDVDMEDRATEVVLNYPNEFLQAVTGNYFVTFYDYSVGIVSLTLHSNLRKYGPFGYECGQPFAVSGGKIVGFQGTASQECLYSIGFHIMPSKSPSSPLCDLCESSDVLQDNAK